MRKAADFRIAPTARRDWESFVVQKSIQDVVDAIFALPPDQRKEPGCPPDRPSWRTVHARVGETLFMMAGSVNANGEWVTAEIVAPVWPPDLGWEE